MLTAGLVLAFVSCKDKEERAFKREERLVEKSLPDENSYLLGTWVKSKSSELSMPDVMIISKDGKLAAYEDNEGGELGLDPEKEQNFFWKTEANVFILDKGWEIVNFYYVLKEETLTLNDERTKNTTATYTKK